MSTLAYGTLTRRREEAPVSRGRSSLPGVKGYVDAVAALVPTEVLAFHALALQFTTETVETEGAGAVGSAAGEVIPTEDGEAVTAITDPVTLRWVFVGLLLAAPILYVVAHRRNHRGWHASDTVRMLIPPIAFVAWTMLQKSTAFDAVAGGIADAPRFLIASAAAIVVGLMARELAFKADATPP